MQVNIKKWKTRLITLKKRLIIAKNRCFFVELQVLCKLHLKNSIAFSTASAQSE